MSKRSFPALIAAGALTAMTGCAPTITVEAGPYATEPICAQVVLSLPKTVLDQQRVKASGQTTAAWGESGAAITFTCGVEPPSPTTQDCQSITVDVFGIPEVFDWISTETESGWTFTSYGREPAMQVQIPRSLEASQPTGALVDVASAVAYVEATHACQ